MRRTRRKQRVVWLRPTGTAQAAGGVPLTPMEQPGYIIFDSLLITLGAGAQPVLEIPLVLDNPVSETFAGASLAVLQASGLNQTTEWGYRLRRIVGSIHLAIISNEIGQNPNFTAVAVTAGLMVRRVDESGLSPLQGGDIHPGLIQNFSDPWVWRRTWLLSCVENPQLTATAFNETTRFAFSRFPMTTDAYGDARSGPHVDAKTARIVGPEDRLFLNIGFIALPAATDNVQEGMQLRGLIDLRVLASLRTNQGNRRNATR